MKRLSSCAALWLILLGGIAVATIPEPPDPLLTPLHRAAMLGDKETVELLIAKGGDLAAKTHDGKTALDLAVERKHDAVADVLRKAGVKG